MKKIYLSPERRKAPGHGVYAYGNTSEHEVCCQIAAIMKPMLESLGFIVYIADPALTIEQRVAEAKRLGVDYYMPIHTNAGGGTGAEVLAYNHPVSIKACQLVYDELIKLYPSKRGVKVNYTFYEINKTPMLSVYPEIAFHDNVADAKWIVESKPSIAEALCRGICKNYGVEFKVPQPTPPTPDHTAELDKLKQQLAEQAAATEFYKGRAGQAEGKLEDIRKIL